MIMKPDFQEQQQQYITKFYVDDCIYLEQIHWKKQPVYERNCELLSLQGLIKKWQSNSKEVADSIPKELKEPELVLHLLNRSDYGKALGVHSDTLQTSCVANTVVLSNHPTKRNLLSAVA